MKCGRNGLSGICSLSVLVGYDLALLLNAQDLVEIDPRDRHERRALLSLRRGEPGVVGGQIDLADEGVGRLDRPDPGELELLDQPVLQRPERPLRAPPGPRRGCAPRSA